MFESCQKAGKAAKHSGDGDTNCCLAFEPGSKNLEKRLGNYNDNRDNPHYPVVKIAEYT